MGKGWIRYNLEIELWAKLTCCVDCLPIEESLPLFVFCLLCYVAIDLSQESL